MWNIASKQTELSHKHIKQFANIIHLGNCKEHSKKKKGVRSPTLIKKCSQNRQIKRKT